MPNTKRRIMKTPIYACTRRRYLEAKGSSADRLYKNSTALTTSGLRMHDSDVRATRGSWQRWVSLSATAALPNHPLIALSSLLIPLSVAPTAAAAAAASVGNEVSDALSSSSSSTRAAMKRRSPAATETRPWPAERPRRPDTSQPPMWQLAVPWSLAN